MSYYLIMFRPTTRADAQVCGVLRFGQEATYDERRASLMRWASKNRPNQPSLQEGEAMWLDEVTVEDAP